MTLFLGSGWMNYYEYTLQSISGIYPTVVVGLIFWQDNLVPTPMDYFLMLGQMMVGIKLKYVIK